MKDNIFRHESDRRVSNQGHTKQSSLWSKEERKGRNGMSKNCQKCCLDIVEDDYHVEAQKRKVGKKERKTKGVKKEE